MLIELSTHHQMHTVSVLSKHTEVRKKFFEMNLELQNELSVQCIILKKIECTKSEHAMMSSCCRTEACGSFSGYEPNNASTI